MGLDFIVSIACLLGAGALGIVLAAANLKRSEETLEARLEVYRTRKKLKNEALRRFLGL